MKKAKCKRTYIICYLLCKKKGKNKKTCIIITKRNMKDKPENNKMCFLQGEGVEGVNRRE